MKKNGNSVVALIWASADKILSNAITVIISIILARLIDPEEYGIIATASIFIVALSLFVEPGMTSALIQKKNSDKLDFSTMQSFNIVFGIVLYIFLAVLSKPIANWFDMPILSLVIKVLGLQIIIGGINSVQIAYVQKNMLFKKYMISSIISISISSAISIVMAFKGMGVWALVTYSLLKQTINTVVTFFLFQCRFGYRFSKVRFFGMLPFASKVLFSKFIDQGYVEVTQLIISKRFSSTDLAFYNKGKSFPELLMNSLNNAISNVMFPHFSGMQDDIKELKKSIRMSIQMSSYIFLPLLIGLCACANSFIMTVLTEKWMNSVPFLQLYCIYYIFIPFSNIIQQSLKAIGASGIVLKIELFKFVLCVVSLVLLLALFKSPIAIALSVAVSYAISFLVECWAASKHLHYYYKDVIADVVPSLIVACIMGCGVLYLSFLNANYVIKLCLQVIVGGGVYLLITSIMKFPQILFIKNLFNNK